MIRKMEGTVCDSGFAELFASGRRDAYITEKMRRK
jgi:hypothetical protein